MSNFRSDESVAPHDEAFGVMADDLDWSRIRHSALLRIAKRAVDIAASLFFFCAFGWLFVAIAIGVLLTSGAPQPR